MRPIIVQKFKRHKKSAGESNLEKRKVTVLVGGQFCSFYSDDSDEYISSLERRANEVISRTARLSGMSSHTSAILSVIYQADALMRTDQERTNHSDKRTETPKIRKNATQASAEDQGQVSVWDLLDNRKKTDE